MKKNETIAYIVLTSAFAVAYVILKSMSIGWITLIFAPLFLVLGLWYFVHGFKFAKSEKKAGVDYALYWITSISLILAMLFFIDGGDVSYDIWHAQIIRGIPYQASMVLSEIFLFATIVSLIAASIISSHRKRVAKKSQ